MRIKVVTPEEFKEIKEYRDIEWVRGTTLSVQRMERRGWRILGMYPNQLNIMYAMVKKNHI